MENDIHGTESVTKIVDAKSASASKKSGFIQAIRRSLAASKPTIKALDALAEVQSTALPPPTESVREAGIASDVYKVDDKDCGGPTR